MGAAEPGPVDRAGMAGVLAAARWPGLRRLATWLAAECPRPPAHRLLLAAGVRFGAHGGVVAADPRPDLCNDAGEHSASESRADPTEPRRRLELRSHRPRGVVQLAWSVGV